MLWLKGLDNFSDFAYTWNDINNVRFLFWVVLSSKECLLFRYIRGYYSYGNKKCGSVTYYIHFHKLIKFGGIYGNTGQVRFCQQADEERNEGFEGKNWNRTLFRDNDHDKDNFYNFFERELSSLLNECYYKSYRTRIECHIGENYITKTIRKKFEIVNRQKKNVP